MDTSAVSTLSGVSCEDNTKDDSDVGNASKNLNLTIGVYDDEYTVNVASENCGCGLSAYLFSLDKFLYSSNFSGKVIPLIQS